jgi:predicted dehydrogenase
MLAGGALTIPPVKIGIAGLGFMGATHIAAYSKIAGAELTAVCAGSERALGGDLRGSGGNLGQHAGVYDFSRVSKCTDWRELVRDDAVEAIDICLPTDLHAQVAIPAFESGKHVLCEKPMALTGEECERMIAAAERGGHVLMIAQVLRFWPEYVALRDFVKWTQYGAVRSATFVRRCGLPDWSRWLPDEKRSGGAVLDLLIHDIDQVLTLFGIPERVAAKQMGGVDTMMATFLYKDRMEVRVQGGWFAPGTPFSMSFQARAERAEMELTPDGVMLSDMSGTRRRVEITSADAYQAQLGYFVECCRLHKAPERCPPSESARAVEIALLLKESRARGGEQLRCLA